MGARPSRTVPQIGLPVQECAYAGCTRSWPTLPQPAPEHSQPNTWPPAAISIALAAASLAAMHALYVTPENICWHLSKVTPDCH